MGNKSKSRKKNKLQPIPEFPVKEERNMGVELFRIVSMILVVMLHVLGHGGVYARTTLLSDNYKVAWFLEAFQIKAHGLVR